MITSWRAAVAGAITFVPGLANFRAVGTGGTDSARYCYSVWLRHVAAAECAGLWHAPQRVAELGPGDSLGIGLAALLSGVERYYAFDVVAHASPTRNLRIFDELVTLFQERQPIPDEDEFPLVKPYLDDYRFPAAALPERRLQVALAPERVARLRADLEALGDASAHIGSGQDHADGESRSIRYVVPWMHDDAGAVEPSQDGARPAPGSLDMIFSQAVMEHVDDLSAAYAAMREWLSADGFISHQIDFKCHGTAREWNGHWRASDLEWSLIRGRKPFLINRQPCSVQLAALDRAGFELCAEKRVHSESPVSRPQLARRFRALSGVTSPPAASTCWPGLDGPRETWHGLRVLRVTAQRILLMLSSQGGGGAERVVSHLAARWVAEGREVELLLTFAGEPQQTYPLPAQVRVQRLGLRGRSPVVLLRKLRLLRRHIHDFGPDVVLALLTNVNVAAVLGTRGLGVPVVVSERIYPPLFPVSRWLDRLRRWTYPRADRVVVQSTAAADWVAAHCPGSRLEVLPNPLVLPLAEGPGALDPARWLGDDERLLLACGRLDAQKAFDVLLDAWARLGAAADGWRLVILGEGGERTALAAQARRLGIAGGVDLPGWAGNPGEWYRRADLFVLSSRYEGFPNALLEAMAHGVCCVSSDCATGPAELIDDGVSGILVAMPAGADAFAEALRPLLASPERRQTLAAGARRRAADFAADRVIPRWSALLDGVADGAGAGRRAP